MAKQTKSTRRLARKTGVPAAPTASEGTGFTLEPELLERALLTGESPGLLEDYFGPQSYAQLRDLSRDAAKRSVRGGPRVLILPGIMGSTLAKKVLGIPDVLWINPVEIALGKLTDLKLDGGPSPYREFGVVLFAYLKLKLRLKIAGFDAQFFPYDWRRSLTDLGAALSDAIAAFHKETEKQVSLVAHSMGGLVARAALPKVGDTVARLIMLGTPNYGSFAPAQAIRGTYDVVQKMSTLDLRHSAEELSSKVFNTFPGLYEMLPSPEKFSALNLYDPAAWPQIGPQPRGALLSAVKATLNQLAPADQRFFLIAGVNQDTVVGLRLENGEFVYQISPDGDGTVPLAFARLAEIPESQIYYVESGHGSLPNHSGVEAAVIDLLSKGTTSALPNQRPASRRAAREVSEDQLRAMASHARGVGQLGSADYRHLLDAVAAPASTDATSGSAAFSSAADADAGTSAGGLSQHFQQLTIGRRRQRRLELTLAHGSITEVDAPAYVLGIFRNVAPTGAAKAIDLRLDGAISEFTARRMFGADVGGVFTLPVGRNRLPADMVLFAGLGAFDRFTADVQQLVAENVIRLLVRSRIDEFATVLIGAGSGESAMGVLQNLLVGFLRGLKDADPNQHFRGITLCETDPTRFGEMKNELYRLAGTQLFDEIEVTLEETEVPPLERPTARVLESGPEPVYTLVRQAGASATEVHYSVSILGAGMKAAVVTSASDIPSKHLHALLDKFDTAVGPNGNLTDIQSYGRDFAKLVLPAEICTVLESMQDRHIVVVHDTEASRIPWETLTIENWSPAVGAGLSRRYLADHLPLATWLEERRAQPTLKMLLIANPLGDLADATNEANRITQLAGATAAIEVTSLFEKSATRAAILSALRGGAYDCVHYAGHAFFDASGPGRSGLVCAGREILSGADLMGISNLPSLVFFNACEAGRIRGVPAVPPKRASQALVESAGVAEALMRGGIANYMSTYWPVGDAAAEIFSTTFYKDVLAGRCLGDAVLHGRRDVLATGVRDWADYILYGSFDFVLKRAAA